MTWTEMQEILDKITYMPHHYLGLRAAGTGEICVVLRADVPDVAIPDRSITVFATQDIPPSADSGMFLSLVQSLCRRQAQHEVDEWLRIDGHCVQSPHERMSLLKD